MAGCQVGVLLEDVVVLGGLLGVLIWPIRWRWAASEMYSVSFLRMSRAAWSGRIGV